MKDLDDFLNASEIFVSIDQIPPFKKSYFKFEFPIKSVLSDLL
jgi:hypothetical protein